ncbi:hypothetical protein [Natronosalvus rutilus]|uniref:CopG family transcriptional regulator n=1 Tax=Natronosalvus rutilus TaxID=2953753 RepID=A0A9E7SZK5_9EURY|nr:hypothetical protein [Natronosalvus rutilus]UTF55993.1 hypothetical protein NGM29_20615 [Natronosalvus rutilus]
MGRRKITEEAERKKQSETEPDQDGDQPDGRDQLTQRMPTDLVEDVDDFAEAHGMSRNAAINFLVRQALPE